MGVKCKVCIRDKGSSKTFPSRYAVVKHRRRMHPSEPKNKQYPSKARRLAIIPCSQKEADTVSLFRYCTQCGRKRKPGWKHCPGCGGKLA